MARFVTMSWKNGKRRIIVYEEGMKRKRIVREQDGPFIIQVMHPTDDGRYEWANEEPKFMKGEQGK